MRQTSGRQLANRPHSPYLAKLKGEALGNEALASPWRQAPARVRQQSHHDLTHHFEKRLSRQLRFQTPPQDR